MTCCQAVNPPDALRCQVCFDTFQNPVQLFGCTHIFCERCVAGANTCPFCRSVIEYAKPAPVSIVEASLSVSVMCGSCGWKGTRAESRNHRCGVTETYTTYTHYPQLPDEELYRRAKTKGSGDIFEDPAPAQESRENTFIPPLYTAGNQPVNGVVFGYDSPNPRPL